MRDYLVKYAKYTTNILIWILGALLFMSIAPKTLSIALPFILGWFIALMANPLVKFLESNMNLKRKFSSMIIIVLVLSLLVLVMYLGIAKLVSEAVAFGSQMPSMYTSLTDDFARIRESSQDILNNIQPDVRAAILNFSSDAIKILSDLAENAGKALVEAATSLAKNIPSIFIAFIITVISSYFMLAQKEEISAIFKRRVSVKGRKTLDIYSKGVNKIIGGYFKAQFKLLAIVGLVLFIGFLFLKVNYALLFSFLIAILDFLPFLGTGTALGPWTIFALISGEYSLATGLVVIYLITQAIRRILEPKILGDTIGMSPLLTLVFMYVGYKLFSVWGLIFAAPFGMILITIYKNGAFDNMIFILKDMWNDISLLKNIDSYKKSAKADE